MSDATTTAPGVTPPASPAPAGNPGNPPVSTEAPPKEPGTTPKPQEKPSNATYARMRIAEKALKGKQTDAPPPPPDDGIDPDEKKVIEKVVEQKYWHLDKEFSELRSESDKKAIQEDVERTIKDSPYWEYLTDDEKDNVHKLSLDEKYVNLSIEQLITLSISGRMTEIGAEMSKKASAKIKETKIPTSVSSMGGQWNDAIRTPEEWAKERAKHGFQ